MEIAATGSIRILSPLHFRCRMYLFGHSRVWGGMVGRLYQALSMG
ncbi:hypothetical protein [Azospirillum doebereinerae]